MRTINQFLIEKKSTVNLNLTSNIVSVLNRSIQVSWTPEMVQDLSAYHNIDVENELSVYLSQELTRLIDTNILNNLSGI